MTSYIEGQRDKEKRGIQKGSWILGLHKWQDGVSLPQWGRVRPWWHRDSYGMNGCEWIIRAWERESENIYLPHSSSCPSEHLFSVKIVVVIAPYGHRSVCVPEFKKKKKSHKKINICNYMWWWLLTKFISLILYQISIQLGLGNSVLGMWEMVLGIIVPSPHKDKLWHSICQLWQIDIVFLASFSF